MEDLKADDPRVVGPYRIVSRIGFGGWVSCTSPRTNRGVALP